MVEVAAAVFLSAESVLVMRRAPDQKHTGFWEFPGGKIEAGETPEQCLTRELCEELLIDATVGAFISESTYEYVDGDIHLMAYAISHFTGEIRLTVHDEMEWVPLGNLLEKQLLPADIVIAQKLLEVLL